MAHERPYSLGFRSLTIFYVRIELEALRPRLGKESDKDEIYFPLVIAPFH